MSGVGEVRERGGRERERERRRGGREGRRERGRERRQEGIVNILVTV